MKTKRHVWFWHYLSLLTNICSLRRRPSQIKAPTTKYIFADKAEREVYVINTKRVQYILKTLSLRDEHEHERVNSLSVSMHV